MRKNAQRSVSIFALSYYKLGMLCSGVWFPPIVAGRESGAVADVLLAQAPQKFREIRALLICGRKLEPTVHQSDLRQTLPRAHLRELINVSGARCKSESSSSSRRASTRRRTRGRTTPCAMKQPDDTVHEQLSHARAREGAVGRLLVSCHLSVGCLSRLLLICACSMKQPDDTVHEQFSHARPREGAVGRLLVRGRLSVGCWSGVSQLSPVIRLMVTAAGQLSTVSRHRILHNQSALILHNH